MDPSKSEVIFEKFEVVCECFKRFLNEVYGTSSMRSPSPIPVDFFAPARGSSRLLSPPPSSPVLPARNVYAVEENNVDKNDTDKRISDKLYWTNIEVLTSLTERYESRYSVLREWTTV